jgi:uncharacterized membrane protein YidH (DUF202 family)
MDALTRSGRFCLVCSLALLVMAVFFVTLAARIAQAVDRPDVMHINLAIAGLLISLSGGLMLITAGLRVVCLFSRPIKKGETAHD